MARTFGITSTASGITGVVINGITRNDSAEIAEARGADGKVTDRKAYSRTQTAEISGLIDGSFSVTAGQVVTGGGIASGLVTQTSITEVNSDYQQFTATIETKDSATNVALS